MTENIGKILETRTKDATVTAANITEGKTAYVKGELITGIRNNNDSFFPVYFATGSIWSSTNTKTYTSTENGIYYATCFGSSNTQLSGGNIFTITTTGTTLYSNISNIVVIGDSSSIDSSSIPYALVELNAGETITFTASVKNSYPRSGFVVLKKMN